MKTWQRRERLMDRRDDHVGNLPPFKYPIDGVKVGEEISRRLAEGWEIMASDTEVIILRSPPSRTKKYVVASYHQEGW